MQNRFKEGDNAPAWAMSRVLESCSRKQVSYLLSAMEDLGRHNHRIHRRKSYIDNQKLPMGSSKLYRTVTAPIGNMLQLQLLPLLAIRVKVDTRHATGD